MGWITDNHAISIGFGVLSAGFWLCSALVKSKIKPHRVIMTMGDGKADVDMHNLILSIQLQSKLNCCAAVFAAIASLGQIGGA